MRILFFASALLMVAGCAAVDGVGTTISNTGKVISGSAQKVKRAL